MHELIVLIEEAVDVDLYDLQGTVAEEGVRLENSPPTCIKSRPVFITDEVAEFEHIRHIIGTHAISHPLRQILVITNVHADGGITMFEVPHMPQQFLAVSGWVFAEVLVEFTHIALAIAIIA
jgi:hypothetical protein